MVILLLFGVGLYVGVGLLFLATSATELLESGRSSPMRLASTLVTSTFWPLTVLVLSAVLVNSRQG